MLLSKHLINDKLTKRINKVNTIIFLMSFFCVSYLLKALSILSYSQSGNFIFFPIFFLITGIMLNRKFFEVGESM